MTRYSYFTYNISNPSLLTGMTIGPNHLNRHIVISPGGRAFEARNPGVLYVSLSRAKSAGSVDCLPDFAFNKHTLLNEDRVCFKPNTALTRARAQDIRRLARLSRETRQQSANLATPEVFHTIVNLVNASSYSIEEWFPLRNSSPVTTWRIHVTVQHFRIFRNWKCFRISALCTVHWDRRHKGASRISQCMRCVAPSVLTYPRCPWSNNPR